MGAGIAQVAALAGHAVLVHDVRVGAADAAIERIRDTLARLAEKGRIARELFEAASSRLRPATSLGELKDCVLVVEAILERLEAKRELFQNLERILADTAILATNTSSISVTAIGAGLERSERLVGMHFFNPAPVMSLVEVVSGAATDPHVAQIVHATALRWGKKPVHARSTPGFIVNRVARPFYAEGLRLLQEGASDPATLDAVVRDCGGFRMGPFELMDLIGHDVNYAVTRSVFDAFYGEARFQPSLIQLELVNAGFLGCKSGRGFYDYRDGALRAEPSEEPTASRPLGIEINTGSRIGTAVARRLEAAGCAFKANVDPHPDGPILKTDGVVLYLTDGRTAAERANVTGVSDLVLIDEMLDPVSAKRAAIAAAPACRERGMKAVTGLLQAAGYAVTRLNDAPGLAVMRTVAMLANEACDAVHQQVCTPAAADTAMRGGVNYPSGPIEWADRIGPPTVLAVLENLGRHYGEPRYRVSPYLRQRVWSGRSLHG